MTTSRILSVVALAVTVSGGDAITASRADAASLRYEIIDYFDEIRPDLTPGDPLDKGFSVSGTIIAKQFGSFAEGFASEAFQSWNLTEQVGSPGQIERTNRYRTGNSSWSLDQSPSRLAPVLLVDFNFIYLVEDATSDNSLVLSNPGIDQQLLWLNREAGSPIIDLWQSSTISVPVELNGRYESRGGGLFPIARRTFEPSPIPLPATGLLLVGAVAALGAQRARRRSA